MTHPPTHIHARVRHITNLYRNYNDNGNNENNDNKDNNCNNNDSNNSSNGEMIVRIIITTTTTTNTSSRTRIKVKMIIIPTSAYLSIYSMYIYVCKINNETIFLESTSLKKERKKQNINNNLYL